MLGLASVPVSCIAAGSRVRLRRLENAPNLNGAVGTVLHCQGSRWVVCLSPGERKVAVPEEQLVAVQEVELEADDAGVGSAASIQPAPSSDGRGAPSSPRPSRVDSPRATGEMDTLPLQPPAQGDLALSLGIRAPPASPTSPRDEVAGSSPPDDSNSILQLSGSVAAGGTVDSSLAGGDAPGQPLTVLCFDNSGSMGQRKEAVSRLVAMAMCQPMLAGVLIFSGPGTARWLYLGAAPYGAVPPDKQIVTLPMADGPTAIADTASAIKSLSLPPNTRVCYVTDGHENCCKDRALPIDATGTTVDMEPLHAAAMRSSFFGAAAWAYQINVLKHLRFYHGFAVLLLGVGDDVAMREFLNSAGDDGIPSALCEGHEEPVEMDALYGALCERASAPPHPSRRAPLRVSDVVERIRRTPPGRVASLNAVRRPSRRTGLSIHQVSPAVAATEGGVGETEPRALTLAALVQRFEVAEATVKKDFPLDDEAWKLVRGVVCAILVASHRSGAPIPTAPFVGKFSALKQLMSPVNKLLHQLTLSSGIADAAQDMGIAHDQLVEAPIVHCGPKTTQPCSIDVVDEHDITVSHQVPAKTSLYSIHDACTVELIKEFGVNSARVTPFSVSAAESRRRPRTDEAGSPVRRVAARTST